MDSDANMLPAEIAHVLFMDMKGYTLLLLEDQVRSVRAMRESVRTTPEFRRSEAGSRLLCVDTGDGMALVFFEDLHSPLQCACEIAQALGQPPRLPLRMGLHSGPVIRTRDINGRENVSGSGIDLAQRVMACGDAGHILLSRSYADLLKPFEHWAGCLNDQGEVEVKHGVRLFLVSFQRGEIGRPFLSPTPEPLPPTNLPFWRTDQFVGRTETLAEMHQRLLSGIPAALVGISGLGKTQAALQYAHLHLRDYPGGVFWINAADSDHLKEDYALLGRSFFGIPETLTLESSVARLRDILSRLPQPALFIFDNITEDTDLQMLPASPPCRLLLTTQKQHFVPPSFEAIDLPKLDSDAVLALLYGPEPEPSVAERAAALEIAEAVGRLPLALSLMAQHRQRLRLTFSEYRQRVLTAPAENPAPETKLFHALGKAREKFVAATGHKGNIYETIERSYFSLNAAARAALSIAACFAALSFSRSLLLDSLAAPDEEAREECEEALADLLDASLISEEASAEPEEGGEAVPRLRLHELVRLFAQVQPSEADQSPLMVRIADVLTTRLQEANENLDWRDIRPDLSHVSTVIAHCRALALPESLHPLLYAFSRYLVLHRDYAAAETHLRKGLELVEGLHGQEHLWRAKMLVMLAEAEQWQGNSKQALRDVRTALGIVRRISPADQGERDEIYEAVGFILKEQGNFTRARRFYEKLRHLYTLAYGADSPKLALCLNNLGMLLMQQGAYEEAEQHLRQALAMEQAQTAYLGPTASMAVYWNNLGQILGRQERWPEALEYHATALTINRRIHGLRHPNVASCLYYSAVASQALKKWPEARTLYQEALHLYGTLFGEDNFRCAAVREKLAALPEAEQ